VEFTAIVDLAKGFLEGSSSADTSAPETPWKTSEAVVSVKSSCVCCDPSLTGTLNQASTPAATLSFSLGIVDPLYEVCARCRDPRVRREALDLLARHPRQECMWSAWSAWKVGKFILGIEEADADATPMVASDIPADHRISEAWLDFSEKSFELAGRGRIAYRRAVPRASPRPSLNPDLFERGKSAETIFTGIAEAGTLPSAGRRTAVPPTLPSGEGSSGGTASEDSPPWIDFDATDGRKDWPLRYNHYDRYQNLWSVC